MKNIKVNNWVVRDDFDKVSGKTFMSAFNDKTGATIRTGLLKDNSISSINETIDAMLNYLIAGEEYDNPSDTNIDAFMGKYPELIDIGIMGW